MFSSASLSALSHFCYCSFLQSRSCSEMQYQTLPAILVTLRSKVSSSSPPLCMACSVVFVFALFPDCCGAASSQPYFPAFILFGLCERELEAVRQGRIKVIGDPILFVPVALSTRNAASAPEARKARSLQKRGLFAAWSLLLSGVDVVDDLAFIDQGDDGFGGERLRLLVFVGA